jgi:hypothetical protein
MEALLIALNTGTIEAEWLRELLMDLPIVEKPILAIVMNCDNQTVIIKMNSSKDNMKSSRHVLTDKRRIPLRSASVRTPHLFHHGIPKVPVNPRSKGIASA